MMQGDAHVLSQLWRAHAARHVRRRTDTHRQQSSALLSVVADRSLMRT
jgi:hypothetical protein